MLFELYDVLPVVEDDNVSLDENDVLTVEVNVPREGEEEGDRVPVTELVDEDVEVGEKVALDEEIKDSLDMDEVEGFAETDGMSLEEDVSVCTCDKEIVLDPDTLEDTAAETDVDVLDDGDDVIEADGVADGDSVALEERFADCDAKDDADTLRQLDAVRDGEAVAEGEGVPLTVAV